MRCGQLSEQFSGFLRANYNIIGTGMPCLEIHKNPTLKFLDKTKTDFLPQGKQHLKGDHHLSEQITHLFP